MSSPNEPMGPYRDNALNVIYNMLFCDNLSLYQEHTLEPAPYPFDILFSDESAPEDLQKVIEDPDTETRVKILAYHKRNAKSNLPAQKELLGVIVEVGLENGLDVLASYANGTARYINQSGKMIIWENPDDQTANHLIQDLFIQSKRIVDQIGPWDNPRKTPPVKGYTRITFLVSHELYFGEAPTEILFNDALASPALMSATRLMQFLTNIKPS